MLIFWDIDGTLMHCGSDGTQALNQTFQKLYGIDDAFRRAGIGRAQDAVVIDRIMTQNGIPAVDLETIKTVFIDNLQRILNNDNEKRVLPGVRGLLRRAAENNILNALLTSNLRAGAECKLRSVDLLTFPDGEPQFIGGGFGDAYGEKWDVAETSRKALERLTGKPIHPSGIILIGDSVYDIKTAKRCGFHSIAAATGWTPPEELDAAAPDMLFADLGDTDAVFAAIRQMGRPQS
ncbi:MAG: HAD hydrolase-like protein [Clostridiales Family XIII bacterium]|nr:HAD hydrolase-like protein [Clostridiales Family XIII bacterium]